MQKFLNSRGFKTRLWVSVLIAVILLPAYFMFDGIALKIVLGLGLAIALIELWNVASCSNVFPDGNDFVLAGGLSLALIMATLCLLCIDSKILGTTVIASVATDIGAYIFGSLLGTKLIEERPFPTISPKKTWEGCFFGIGAGMLAVFFWTNGETRFFWMVPVAFLGDLLESLFKRRFHVKDSNDYIIQLEIPVLKQIEGLLGGRNGHGGFFDRLDSLSLVLAIQFILSAVL